jgi:hypothetical protein
VVLGRRADHRRPADVDVLDAGGEVRARGGGLLEGAEVHVQQVDAADPVRRHRLPVLGGVAHAEQAAVHRRVQGLDPPVHHLREAGEVGNVLHRQAGVGDRLARPAGGDEFDAQGGEGLGGLHEAGLVGDRDERAFHGDAVGGGREIGGGGHGILLCDVREMPRRAAELWARAPRWSPTSIRQSRGTRAG